MVGGSISWLFDEDDPASVIDIEISSISMTLLDRLDRLKVRIFLPALAARHPTHHVPHFCSALAACPALRAGVLDVGQPSFRAVHLGVRRPKLVRLY